MQYWILSTSLILGLCLSSAQAKSRLTDCYEFNAGQVLAVLQETEDSTPISNGQITGATILSLEGSRKLTCLRQGKWQENAPGSWDHNRVRPWTCAKNIKVIEGRVPLAVSGAEELNATPGYLTGNGIPYVVTYTLRYPGDLSRTETLDCNYRK